MRSLVFETPPLDRPIEILGAAIVTLDVASDRPIANLAVRLCDVHPSGESLRVSYGVLNLTHRDGHEKPALLAIGERYRVRIKLNDAGVGIPGRPPGEARPIHGLLADDLAGSREGDAADFWWHARSAAAPAPGHRRAAVAVARSGDGATREADASSVAAIRVSSASTASAWNWARRVNPSFTSRTTTPSAQWPSCDGPRRCRETPGRSASRRRCGCHARAMSSCCREVCARGKARTKSVFANGIAPFHGISCDDPRRAAFRIVPSVIALARARGLIVADRPLGVLT